MAKKKDAKVIKYCWEINKDHPRLPGGVGHRRGGAPVTLGQRGRWFPCSSTPLPRHNPWGLTQIWLLKNGQEIRVKHWK